MKNNFKGWNTVFGFTFRQATKGMGFRAVTSLVAILIVGVIILINIVSAKPEEKQQDSVSRIESVHVLDISGLPLTDYKQMNPQLTTEQFRHIKYITESDKSREDVIKAAASESTKSMAVIISKTAAGYELEAILPDVSELAKHEAQRLLDQMIPAFESNKLMQAGLSQEQLSAVMKPAVTFYTDIGENTSEITYVIKLVAPMLFGLMMYFMLLLYGQTVSKSVSTEKTSKLMETLLTSIHPYALITGKILAITSMALMQFVTWIVAGVIGLYSGNAAAHAIYPEYESTVMTFLNFVKDHIGETAMTLPAVILSVIGFGIGFLFYCVIAGLTGCLVSKPEDVSSTQSLFVFPVVISWLICYFASIMGNEEIMNIVRYIPFTAPFSVPVDLITGAVGLPEGILALVLLSLFTLFVIMLSARIYKGLVLYNGQKLSLKMIGNVIKANK